MNRIKIVICAVAVVILMPIVAVHADDSHAIPVQPPTISTNHTAKFCGEKKDAMTENSVVATTSKTATTSKKISTTKTTTQTKPKVISTTKKTTSTAKSVDVITTTEASTSPTTITTTTKNTEKTTTKQEPITTQTTTTTKSYTSALYSASYFKRMGVLNWGGYRWTWYSQRILPGQGLNIPGRHVDENGYVCDGNNYICVANDALPRYTVIDTPFGKKGKVYDRGCGNYTIDVYVNW